MKQKFLLSLLICGVLTSCIYFSDKKDDKPDADTVLIVTTDSLQALKIDSARADSAILVIDTLKTDSVLLPSAKVHTKSVHPQQVVDFAKTLVGIPYKYGSSDPSTGFDCSGFITYVFTHFKIIVPRSSIDFTNVGRAIPIDSAKPGDLILFTGTDSTEKFVGHMGLVVSNQGVLEFIHSTSGKKYSVTITPMSPYYRGRYVKTIRIFPQNDK